MIVVEKIYERGADSSPVTETAPPLSRVVITATMQCDHPLILFHKYFIFLEMNISYRGTHLQLPRSTFIKLLPITINWFISFPNPVKAANLSNSSISIPAFPQDGYWALTRSSALQTAGDSGTRKEFDAQVPPVRPSALYLSSAASPAHSPLTASFQLRSPARRSHSCDLNAGRRVGVRKDEAGGKDKREFRWSRDGVTAVLRLDNKQRQPWGLER